MPLRHHDRYRASTIVKVVLLAPIVAASVGFAAATSAATVKTPVQVRFELAEPSYLNALPAGTKGAIESSVALSLARRLANRFGHLDFTTDAGPERILAFTLATRDPRETGFFREVGFRIVLAGPGARGERFYWKFRPGEEYGQERWQRKEDFLLAVEIKLDSVDTDYEGLIGSVLKAIPIATQAEFVPDPLVGWVIPVRCRDLCIDAGSILLVDSAVRLSPALGSILQVFRARSVLFEADATHPDPLDRQLVGQVEPDQRDLQNLSRLAPADISVRGVYVLQYRRVGSDEACGRAIPPEDAAFEDDGGNQP